MKFLLILISSLLLSSFSNVGSVFPQANLKTLAGKSVQIDDIISKKKKTIISFWASWCKPCKSEMDAISEYYEEWQKEYDVEFIAITIDDARGLAKVPGIISSKEWPFTFLSDPNQDLMRSLNFQTIPQTFVVDAKRNILYSHSGYSPGDEIELEDHLK